jgi:cobalt/nickel transport system permease protein
MHHDFLDKYSRIDSPIHRSPAGVKSAVALAVVFAVVLAPREWIFFYFAVAVGLSVIAVVSRIPAGFLIRRIVFFEFFILIIALLALFQPGGYAKFGIVVLKSTLSLSTVLLLANSTPFSRLLGVLRRIRVPGAIITILALMYRYLFVLIDEAERIRRARESRTFERRKAGHWIVLASVLGQLFVRSTERAERIYAAMCARGWKP